MQNLQQRYTLKRFPKGYYIILGIAHNLNWKLPGYFYLSSFMGIPIKIERRKQTE